MLSASLRLGETRMEAGAASSLLAVGGLRRRFDELGAGLAVLLIVALVCAIWMFTQQSRWVSESQGALAAFHAIEVDLLNREALTARAGLENPVAVGDRRAVEAASRDIDEERSRLSDFFASRPDESARLSLLDAALRRSREAVDVIWSRFDAGERDALRADSVDPELRVAEFSAKSILLALESDEIERLDARRGVQARWLLFVAVVLVLAFGIALRHFRGLQERVLQSFRSSAEKEAKLLHLALQDPLTNLLNRRSLNERFARARSFADQTTLKLALVVVDLDRFKTINDEFGHDAGDHVLVEAARRIAIHCGDFDTVARLGGDEFVVIFHRSSLEQVQLFQKRLQGELNRPTHLNGQVIPVSASVGAAFYPSDGKELHELIRSADERMYQKKEARAELPTHYDVLARSAREVH